MNGSTKFIYNLKLLVDDLDSNYVISWNKSGDSICIHDKLKLTEILPRYFRSKNFNSFIRQLNLYGFQRIRSTRKSPCNKIIFKHKYFVKDFPNQMSNVQRNSESRTFLCAETQTDSSFFNDVNKKIEHFNITNTNDNLRLNMLENEIDSLKAEIIELRASFSSIQVKLSNQQNLFYAAFRAMNNPKKNQSDMLLNVFIKPSYQSKLTLNSEYKFQNDSYQSEDSMMDSLNTLVGNNGNHNILNTDRQKPPPAQKSLLQLTSETSNVVDQYCHTNETYNMRNTNNCQSIKQTYDVISNNYLNNPNFFNNYPIFVSPIRKENDLENDDKHKISLDIDDDFENCPPGNGHDSSYFLDILSNLTDASNSTDLD